MNLDAQVKAHLMSLPGKRGLDIPEDAWDRIHSAALGETHPVWGDRPTPQQMQHLYDNNLHEPEQVKEFFGGLNHPHVPGIKVNEYPAWEQAYSTYKEHGPKEKKR